METKVTDRIIENDATLSERGQKAYADTMNMVIGWTQVAEFLSANPDILDQAYAHDDNVLVCLSYSGSVMDRLADYARRAKAAGARVEKEYGDLFGGVKLWWGGVHIWAYANREQVCERVPTGVETVTKEVPDPSVVVPLITVTEDVETYKWVCKPILAGEQAEVPA